jgi:hypothetical protein
MLTGQSEPTTKPTWHALLIGVDAYPHLTPGEQLSGCANDAEAMLRFLVERVQIPEGNLHCLTAPHGAPAKGPAREAATAANIRAAFDSLTKEHVVAPGDHVLLFYAGHGLRLSRAVAAGGAFQRYHAFAPADLGRSPVGLRNLILDRELHDLLRALEGKQATVTVIADTCHSGSVTRGEMGERCIRMAPLEGREWQALTEAHPALGGGVATADGAAPGAAGGMGRMGEYAGGDFVVLAACHDTETAKEDDVTVLDDDGMPQRIRHGVLTIHLLEELRRVPAERIASLRWADFHERLRGAVVSHVAALRASSQVPAIEGRKEKTVFGGAWRPFSPGFTVRLGQEGTLRVDGGSLHGLDAGAVLAVHPPDTADFHAARSPGIEAVIASATPMSSEARLRDPAQLVADRSRARLLRASPTEKPIAVRLVAVPEAITRVAAADSGSSGWFTFDDAPAVGARDLAHVELRPWKGAIPAAAWPEKTVGLWTDARDGWVLVRTDRFGAPSERRVAEPAPEDILAYLPGAGSAVDALVQLARRSRAPGRPRLAAAPRPASRPRRRAGRLRVRGRVTRRAAVASQAPRPRGSRRRYVKSSARDAGAGAGKESHPPPARRAEPPRRAGFTRAKVLAFPIAPR